MSDFQTFITEERSRLTKKREELTAQITDLQTAISGIDRELGAITAYEKARTGKDTPPAPAAREGRREKIVRILQEKGGLTPKEIIAKLGGNFHEGGIHTLLSGLKKKGVVTAEDGKYSLP